MKKVVYIMFFVGLVLCAHAHAPSPIMILEKSYISVCHGEEQVQIAYLTTTGIEYKISSVDGFLNMEDFEDLPESPILVRIPSYVTAGTYVAILRVTDGVNTEVYPFVVEILPAPKIVSVSPDQTLCYGVDIPALYVTATGGSDMVYRWEQKMPHMYDWDNASPEGEVQTSYYKPPALTYTTLYRCIVTSENGCGTDTSTVITVNIKPRVALLNQSGNQVVCYNTQPSTLSVTTTDIDGLTYRWEQSTNGINGWEPSSGLGASSKRFTPNALIQSTYYRCVVKPSFDCDSVVSNNILVTVRPEITVFTPEGQTICYNTAPNVLMVSVTGENLSYQWQKSSNGFSDWTNVPSAARANNSFYYTPPKLTTTTYYRCLIMSRDGCQQEESGTIKITVRPEMKIETQAEDQVVCSGKTPATMRVTTSGGEFAYQWQRSGTGTSEWSDIDNATWSSYTPNAQNSNYYRCTATPIGNDCESLVSKVIYVKVLPEFKIESISGNQSICYNTVPTVLSVSAKGSDLTYQWQQRNSGIGSWKDVEDTVGSGAKTPHYLPPALTSSVYYRCSVTDAGCGTENSTSVYIAVYSSVEILSQSGNQTVCHNVRPTSIQVTVTSGANVAYQWQQSSTGVSDWVEVPSATSRTYWPAVLTASTYYRCVITPTANGCEQIVSENIHIKVLPEFDIESTSGTQTICYNTEPSVLSVSAKGADLTYQWKQSSNVSFGWKNAEGGTGATSPYYSPPALTSSTYYRCTVSSPGYSSEESDIILVTVSPQAQLLSQSGNQIICYNTQPSSMQVAVTAGANVTYQWQQSNNGTSGWSNVFGGTGATTNSYRPSTLTETAYYRCQITPANNCGTMMSNVIQVTVLPELKIVSTSANQTIWYNTVPEALTVTATGANLTYQWQYNSNNGSIGWTNVSPDSDGKDAYYYPRALTTKRYYRCRVSSSDGCASKTSDVIEVDVLPELKIESQSAAQTVCYNAVPQPLQVSITAGIKVTYLWQQSTTGVSGWVNVSSGSGGTTAQFTPPALTESIYYRCIISPERVNSSLVSTPVLVTVLQKLVVVSHPANQLVCYNTVPSALRVDAVGGQDLTYQWQESMTALSDWTNAQTGDGATTPVYNPPALMQTTYYRCVVYSGNNCTEETSEVAEISVLDAFDAGAIASGSELICQGQSAETIQNITEASGGSNSIEYRWNCNNIPIENSNRASYTPNITSPGTYIYLREAKDELCGAWKSSEGYMTITVIDASYIPTKPIGPEALCQFTEKAYYTVEEKEGIASYRWEIAPANAGEVLGNSHEVAVLWNRNYSGTAQLKVQALSQCGTSAGFSEALSVRINAAPQVEFTEFVNPVCANQKNAYYAVTSLEGAAYIWKVTNGTIVSGGRSNYVRIDWDETAGGSIGELSVEVTSEAQCLFESTIQVAILDGYAPIPNDIISKDDKEGYPYVLIYPNPEVNMIYQWYKDDIAIEGATEQFYYIPETDRTLSASYKVFIAEEHAAACGSFTKPFVMSKKVEIDDEELFVVYPNPSKGDFTLSFNRFYQDHEGREMTLIITSIAGQKILEKKITGAEDIHLGVPLSKGSYLVTITTADKKRFSKTIIIQ